MRWSGSLGFVWVHSDTPRDRRVDLGSCWFTTSANESLDSLEFAGVQSGAPSGFRINWGLRGLTRGRLGVVEFIRVLAGSPEFVGRLHDFTGAGLCVFGLIPVCVGSLGREYGSLGSFRSA